MFLNKKNPKISRKNKIIFLLFILVFDKKLMMVHLHSIVLFHLLHVLMNVLLLLYQDQDDLLKNLDEILLNLMMISYLKY